MFHIFYANDTPEPISADDEPIPNAAVEINKTEETVPDHNADNSPSTSVAPEVGDHVEVFWPLDKSHYAEIVAEEQSLQKPKLYDNGGVETLYFSNETWSYVSSAQLISLSATTLQLERKVNHVLAQLLEHFVNRPFMRLQAQAFLQFCLAASYRDEKLSFKKTVKVILLANAPGNANIIVSHVLYEMKVNDDMFSKLKVLIAPHGNANSAKLLSKSDCSICPPTGFRNVA